MTGPEFESLRDKERVVLHHVKEGHDDVQKITSETTLENHHVTYAFEKLEELGLIQVEKPDGMVERVINGQKRVFQHPKQATLTDKGTRRLKADEPIDTDRFDDLSHQELVEKVHKLETELNELQQKFGVFHDQVQQHLD